MSAFPRPTNLFIALITFILCVIGLLGYTYWLTTPPASFTPQATLTVTSGSSLAAITHEAAKAGIVRSPKLLYIIMRITHDHQAIYAGTYKFDHSTSVFGVAQKLASQQVETPLVKITIPEGLRAREIADLVHKQIPNFSTSTYVTLASTSEGYLFPDTYLVPTDFTPAALLKLQKENLTKHLAPLQPAIASSSLSEQQILTLASLLEREADDETSMKLVSGILQNRLKRNMPLQVDASIEYVLKKPLTKLTPKDLKIDSPYNTYLHRGLPPTPIDNPVMMAINAVVHPTPSPYLYYLTGTDGTFHYAKTLAQHKQNVARYLR